MLDYPKGPCMENEEIDLVAVYQGLELNMMNMLMEINLPPVARLPQSPMESEEVDLVAVHQGLALKMMKMLMEKSLMETTMTWLLSTNVLQRQYTWSASSAFRG